MNLGQFDLTHSVQLYFTQFDKISPIYLTFLSFYGNFQLGKIGKL